MTSRTVARQYANALFDVVEKHQRTDAVAHELTAFSSEVLANDELRRLFKSPIPLSRKRALIDALAEAWGPMAAEITRMLALLADHDRLTILGDIATIFAERAREARHIVRAEITSAVPLESGAKAALVAALGRATGRSIEMSERVDPEVIGGIVAKMGSVVYDASVRRQIERIRERLLVDTQTAGVGHA